MIQTGFTGPFTSNINAIATNRKQDLCLIYTPVTLCNSGGSLFPVDPNQLIKKVILSPQFRITEARALDSILRQQFPSIRISISPLLSVEEPPEIIPARVITPR